MAAGIKNLENAEIFEKTISDENLVVVHFWAEWAAQCGPMDEVMEELAKDVNLKDVIFAKVLAESIPETSLKYNISAVPTFLLFRNNKVVEKIDGANAAELTKKVKQEAGKPISKPIITIEIKKEDLNIRLKKLVNTAPVMLFMKGYPQDPRCGFSKQIVAILNAHNAQYSTFDILSDEEIRQGLKTYSNWPTYPQLYIGGELIGGLDIVKEMVENGELTAMLPKRQTTEEKLKAVINQHKVMIFMKGDRSSPKCGFSRQLMEIMKETGVSFETFNILENEEVRQQLKTFSNWPTYPQVYIKGELIGGLDIVKELKENNELMGILPAKLEN